MSAEAAGEEGRGRRKTEGEKVKTGKREGIERRGTERKSEKAKEENERG